MIHFPNPNICNETNLYLFLVFRRCVSQSPTCPCLMLSTLMTWRSFELSPSPCQLPRRRWEEVEELSPADVPHPLLSDAVLIWTLKHLLSKCCKQLCNFDCYVLIMCIVIHVDVNLLNLKSVQYCWQYTHVYLDSWCTPVMFIPMENKTDIPWQYLFVRVSAQVKGNSMKKSTCKHHDISKVKCWWHEWEEGC